MATIRPCSPKGPQRPSPVQQDCGYVHAVLRKAFDDAVRTDQILATTCAGRTCHSWHESGHVFRMEAGTPLFPDIAGELMRRTIQGLNSAHPETPPAAHEAA